MKPIKLLHITYDMNIGGTEQVIRNLVEGLDSEKFSSSILCIDGEVGPWGKELQEKGYRHYCLKREPGFDWKLIKQIRELIKEERFDIVHCHQYTPYTYGWFGSLFTRAKVIFTEHGRFYPDVSSWKRKLVNPLMQMKTASITSISKATKDALVKYENFNGKKIEVIYNGIADLSGSVTANKREELGILPNEVVFGTISRLDPIKNHVMMIKAFAEVVTGHPEAKLLIVGDGQMRDELEALVAELGVKGCVIFTGFKPNPKDYLAAMDVFLLPSFSEGTSMTLLEAMSFSKASIATAVGGTPEIIVDNRSGLLIENDDLPALVKCMGRILEEEGSISVLGKGAREEFQSRFRLGVMSDAYSQLYFSTVEKLESN